MSLTITQARDSILGHFRSAWIAASESVEVPIFWQDAKEGTQGTTGATIGEQPPTDAPWARVTLQHAAAFQASLADATNKKIYTRNGVLTVQIFTPKGTGLTQSDTLVKVVQDAFEGKEAIGGVWFRNVRANEIGLDGGYHQTNVLVEFTYDEVK